MRVGKDTLMNARGLVLVAGIVVLVAYIVSRLRS